MRVRANETAAFGGIFLFGIVMALLGAVLPVVSKPLGLGLDSVGNLFLVLNTVLLAGGLVFGVVVDRFGYKGALTAGPLLVAAALVLIVRAGSPEALGGALVLLGLGGSALNGATNTLVADLHAEPRAKAAALNRLGVFFASGALFLPLLMGVLLGRLGLEPLLLAAAGLSVLIGLLSATPRYPPAKQPEGLSLRDALDVLRHPFVALLGALLFFQAGSEMLLAGFLTTYLTGETGASIQAASWVLTGYWMALVTARALLGRLLVHVPALTLVPFMGAGASVALALAAFAPGFLWAAGLFLLAALALGGVTPTILGVAGAAVPARTGAVFGLLFSASLMGAMTVPWLTGHLAAAAGLRVMPLLGAACLVAVTLLALRARRQSRETRAPRISVGCSILDRPKGPP